MIIRSEGGLHKQAASVFLLRVAGHPPGRVSNLNSRGTAWQPGLAA